MILNFNDDSFNLDGVTKLTCNNEIAYTCIYDFSYKRRIRILDASNNEVAYIQFRVLSEVDQITLFDKNNNQIAYIKLTDDVKNIIIEDDGWKYFGSIDNYELVDKDNKVIMSVANNNVNIVDDNNIYKCIFALFAYANINELKA